MCVCVWGGVSSLPGFSLSPLEQLDHGLPGLPHSDPLDCGNTSSLSRLEAALVLVLVTAGPGWVENNHRQMESSQ